MYAFVRVVFEADLNAVRIRHRCCCDTTILWASKLFDLVTTKERQASNF